MIERRRAGRQGGGHVGAGVTASRFAPGRIARASITGARWFLTTPAGSGDATLYSIGRGSQWLFEPLLIPVRAPLRAR
jgi:hypothetical protein